MKQGTTYRVLKPVVLSTDRQCYMPGDIVDLSHQTPAGIEYFIKLGYFETADGEPKNAPAPASDEKATTREAPCRGCE